MIVTPTAGEVPAAADELNAEISELFPLVEVEHLTRFGKPLRAVTLDAQPETILLFLCGECRPRHQMLVERPMCDTPW
ncbi:MAG: hypothetical protein E5V34_09090 [Mesorhizobium sp.]|nr:MAG: hypothetical protein E5V34_09090 [Mesorhizobium sp.]